MDLPKFLKRESPELREMKERELLRMKERRAYSASFRNNAEHYNTLCNENPDLIKTLKEPFYLEIKDNDRNPKLAEIKSAFDALLEHPLVKKFKRNKMRLYVYHDNSDAITVNAFLKKLDRSTIRIWNGKYVAIASELLDILTADEIKSGLAHELGHQLRSDHHARNIDSRKDSNPQDKEKCADKISVLISRDPETLISVFDKLKKYGQQKIDDFLSSHSTGDPGKDAQFKESFERALSVYCRKYHLEHPEKQIRNKLIREAGERLINPESERELLAEIESELLGRHTKIFPNHVKTEYPGLFTTKHINRKTDTPLEI